MTVFTTDDNIEYMIEQIKKAMLKLESGKLYSPEDIHALGVILNTKLQPSMFTVYRLIKHGKLPAVNIGAGAHARHFVKGEDLKKYLQETYKL